MWRSLWRSIDRFSLQHFRHLVSELQEIKNVNKLNREFVVDILSSIVEVVIYGDQHDKSIFECFMEYQILAEFLRVLKISRNSGIEAPLLQYLSIMIQNLASDHAIYYCFSNEYINNIILHQYGFDGSDLVHYYISFLRTVSGKVNRDTICLLVKVQEDVVVSFPLYCEALKFAHHEEKMIQIAVRALTLNIYNASDGMVYKFITNPPVSEYFSEVVLKLSQKCIQLDTLITTAKDVYSQKKRKELFLETEKVIDDLYYCNDILRVDEPCLSALMTQILLNSLILPVLLPPLLLSKSNGFHVSSITSLFILSHILQIVVGKELLNSVALALLYPLIVSSVGNDGDKGMPSGTHTADSFAGIINSMEEIHIDAPEAEEVKSTNKSNIFYCSSDKTSLGTSFMSCLMGDIHNKRIPLRRSGILSLIFSENHSLLLASLMLLIILSERKDLDHSLLPSAGFADMKIGTEEEMIVNVLFKILKKQPPLSVMTQWNAGWVLRKLLICLEKKLSDDNIYIFKISFKQSSERLLKELKGSWLDYIPHTLGNEWEKCKLALEESPQLKDPFSFLELSLETYVPEGDNTSSSRSWQRMVDAVKIFVLHHLLDACMYERDSLESSLWKLRSTFGDIRGKNVVDAISVTYGSYMSLGTGAPCKIAFSEREQKDVYMIPMAEGVSGMLYLADKLPLHANRGIVIAMVPLAGLHPKTDDDHQTWLHLQIRDFNPSVHASKATESDEVYDGRWTLGFPSAEACQAALSLIKKETDKQRSSVQCLLTPFLLNCSLESVSE